MALPSAPAPLYSWPWRWMGCFKYLLYLPIAWAAYSSLEQKTPISQNFSLHILILTAARLILYQLWQTFSRFLPLTESIQIRPQGLSYAQVDREWHCDDHHLLQALVLFGAHSWLGFLKGAPVWRGSGLLMTLLLHTGPAEMIYYWFHRFLHSAPMFERYHKLHHESVTPEPSTPGLSTFLEQISMVVIMAVPIVGGSVKGQGSLSALYAYVLLFDCMRCMGHCNAEMFSPTFLANFPLIKYLIYTPSYHTLHHEERDSNYCLFMPIYDYMFGTVSKNREAFLKEIRERVLRVPDYVFLLHAVDFLSCLHVHFLFRAFASHGYRTLLFLIPIWPFVIPIAIAMWIWGKPFKGWNYYLDNRFHQIRLIPRFGFMYFLPFARNNINNLIEKAILDADRMGVKVLSLAALNKNEALNGGGNLFVMKHPNLNIRVCHGNTLTAAVIIKEIPDHVTEVFLTGATSKLGRAIALYLCQKGVRVLMLTESRKRFESITSESPAEFRHNLVQVTKHQAGKNCKTWILGKWTTYSDQMFAPPGTHFHQFVVPPVIPFRRDCTYGALAAMRLPPNTKGLASCEYTLDRNVVHACHAGGVVHALEGWTHNEVGALDVDRIDLVWEAAMRHGFRPA